METCFNDNRPFVCSRLVKCWIPLVLLNRLVAMKNVRLRNKHICTLHAVHYKTSFNSCARNRFIMMIIQFTLKCRFVLDEGVEGG